MSVPNLKRIALFFQKLLGGSQNFEFVSRDPKPRPLWGHFMIQTQYGPVLYICAKFEADISIRSKVRGVPKFRNSVVTQATPTLGSLCDPDAVGVRPLSVPNLKRVSLLVQKL